jgi:hypothetical protein
MFFSNHFILIIPYLKGGEGMSINSMNLEVKVNVTNIDQFNDLVKMFNKKAHELEELAHKLNMFRFEADILSNDGN